MSVLIPITCPSKEMVDVFRSFFNDFCRELKKRRPDTWQPEAFWIKYLSNYGIYKNSEIAQRMPVKVVGERVRQVLERYSVGILGMLKNGTEFNGMLPSPEMKTAFDRLFQDLKPVERFDMLLERYGFGKKDADILLCMLDCLNYDLIRNQDLDPYVISKEIFGRANTKLANHISPLSRHLRSNPVPRCYETDVLPFMRSKKWDDGLQQLMTEFLRANEHEYEWSGPDSMGHTWVAKRWEALGGEDKRMERILYDYYTSSNQTDGWMNVNEIRKEYDHRADLYRLPHMSLNPSFSGEHVDSRGNGDYRYSVNPVKITIDMHQELRSYMAGKNGLSTLADAFAFANTLKKCSESLVTRYLSENGCVGGRLKGAAETYYCREEDLDKYPSFIVRGKGKVTAGEVISAAKEILIKAGKPLDINDELLPLFEKKTGKQGLNKVSFRNLLKRAECILFDFPKKGMIRFSIPLDQAKAFDVDSLFPPREKTRKEFVQEVAAEILLASPDHTMKKADLCKAILEEGAYPETVNITNLYGYLNTSLFTSVGRWRGGSYTLDIAEYNKRFGFEDSFNWITLKSQVVSLVNDPRLDASVADKMYSIMENVAVLPFDNSCEMWRILKLLNGYLNGKPTANDKELLVFKLQVGLEVYLKQYAGNPSSQDTLYPCIANLQGNGKLPTRMAGKYPAGSIEYDIDVLTGKMISIRNNICHRLNEGYNNDKFYAQRIVESLKYYLLVAAYAVKHHH